MNKQQCIIQQLHTYLYIFDENGDTVRCKNASGVHFAVNEALHWINGYKSYDHATQSLVVKNAHPAHQFIVACRMLRRSEHPSGGYAFHRYVVMAQSKEIHQFRVQLAMYLFQRMDLPKAFKGKEDTLEIELALAGYGYRPMLDPETTEYSNIVMSMLKG